MMNRIVGGMLSQSFRSVRTAVQTSNSDTRVKSKIGSD